MYERKRAHKMSWKQAGKRLLGARVGGIPSIVVLAALSQGIGCAERDPINRATATRTDKHLLLGADLADFADDPEFRMKSFNIDQAANAENFAGTIGGASAVERVRWEVTEDWLFARRSYQETPGADKKALPRTFVNGRWEFPTKADGTIIAAYKIEKHFDVRADYNPGTGEATNITVENDSDRVWNEREFMRVDWSENLAISTSGDTSWVFGGGGTATAIKYAPTDPNDPDRPYFAEAGKGYFDITNKYQLMVQSDPAFGVPECVIVGYFNGTSSFDCTPPEVKNRTSYELMTGNEDFEPFEESFAQRDIIGNWGNAGNTFNREYGAPPITTWDPQYGYTDAKTRTFFALHNIWEKSHWDKACDNNDDNPDSPGTALQCGGFNGSSGSQCDVQVGKCTIPVRDRAIKTMGWWINKEAPLEFLDKLTSDGGRGSVGPIEEMTDTWNTLFKVSVAYRREVECRRTGGDRDECHAQFFEVDEGRNRTQMVSFGAWGTDVPKELPVDGGKPIVTSCHYPVRNYDQPMCGERGSVARLGDVRKNYIIYWPFASRAPYGGVASIGADPLTGEMVGATATIMGRSVTAAAAQVRDIIQLNSGDLTIEGLIDGEQQVKFADRVRGSKVEGPGSMRVGKTPAELEAHLNSLDRTSLASAFAKSPFGVKPGANGMVNVAKTKVEGLKALSPNGPGMASDNDKLNALIGQIAPTAAYQEMLGNRPVNKMLAQLRQNGLDESDATFQTLAKFGAMDPEASNKLYERYMAFLGARGVCFHDSQMAATTGSVYLASLAGYFQQRFSEGDAKEKGVAIYNDLIGEIIKGIGFHEVGHALGMRHNFGSSWDALNYSPQYWQLRTAEGTKTAECKTAGAACMGPRYLDPIDDDEAGRADESRPQIEYFGNTSTMEYQIERFGETVGAGTYDQHFIKTLYGRVVETFDPNLFSEKEQQNFQAKHLSQGIAEDFVSSGAKYQAHYTKTARLAKNFDPDRDCRDATEEEKAVGKWRIVHGRLCAPPPKGHVAYADLQSGDLSLRIGAQVVPVGNGTKWRGPDYQSGGTVIRWPYRYGEDYSSGGYLHAKLFDSGADIYEITQNVIKRFDLTYPWQYFRRLNKEFAWWSIPGSVRNSTFARLRGYHWNTARDLAGSIEDLKDDDIGRPAVEASAAMFDFMQRAILMPEPGSYWPFLSEERLRTKDAANRTSYRPGASLISDAAGNCADYNPPYDQQCKDESFNVALGDGRFIQLEFDNVRGGSWDYQQFLKYAGFDEEKALALRELVDSRPTLSTVSRDNALDGRDVFVSWRTDVPHAVDRLIGGIMSEDWEAVGPSLGGNGLQQFPIYNVNPTQLVRPEGAAILFPNVGYAQQTTMAIYAMLFSRASSDLTLVNKMRIQQDGDNGAIPPDGQRVAFLDPLTGTRYLALKFGTETINGRAVEKGIASRMLQRANELAQVAYGTEAAPLVADPDTGELTYPVTNGLPVPTGNTEQLRRYVGLLDVVRQVSKILGTGPLGGGGGGDDEE